jgi:hypothetical protein
MAQRTVSALRLFLGVLASAGDGHATAAPGRRAPASYDVATLSRMPGNGAHQPSADSVGVPYEDLAYALCELLERDHNWSATDSYLSAVGLADELIEAVAADGAEPQKDPNDFRYFLAYTLIVGAVQALAYAKQLQAKADSAEPTGCARAPARRRRRP